eukprot:CAMPEP_0181519786 /NCGR_PEP_ID=MMETSP1110-20121109/65969_1 /TAXON_ID=174948 /ORGANISM="Symbiodinium sp., Strain CCMP421" /LENGTH=41 /DNA_ID= /DNA_START= /DNA_END= /DNA_ORIENTATION=
MAAEVVQLRCIQWPPSASATRRRPASIQKDLQLSSSPLKLM